MSNLHPSENNTKPEIAKMLQESISQTSALSLHPHFYSSLYQRASEVKALDKILSQLQEAAQNAKAQNYRSLPPILRAIKETLEGRPPMSWWNVFTFSLGYALTTAEETAKNNDQEIHYLTQISQLLTTLIRNYQAPNTKLLLEIRLTALEVDSRLVEINKIPQDTAQTNETLDYLSSEFQLINQELLHTTQTPKESWVDDTESLLRYVSKANKLLKVLQNVKDAQPETFDQFCKLSHLKNLYDNFCRLLQESTLILSDEQDKIWMAPQLDSIFSLFDFFPDLILTLTPNKLYPLLRKSEQLFIADTNLGKVRPPIFASHELKVYLTSYNQNLSENLNDLKKTVKGKGTSPSNQQLVSRFKQTFIEENDLHHISTMVLFKGKEYQSSGELKSPAAIQQEILSRMITLANLSQPRELDAVLKSFSDDERENRYFITQEVILEQFIRWRKLGIY